MDPRAVLINASQLIQMLILMGDGMKLNRVHWQILVPCLKLLQPLVEEVRDSVSGASESDLLLFVVSLERALARAKELLDKTGAKGSRVFRVLCCQEIAIWFEEVTSMLKEALISTSFESLHISEHNQSQAELCIQELTKASYFPDISDQMLLNEIEMLLVETREHQHVRHEKLLKLFGKLDITTDEALTKELDALEKVKEKARLGKHKSEEEYFERVISLLMQMVKYSPDGIQVKEEVRGLAVPADFRCPLSLELMGDPVIVASGQTYERAYIQQWLDQGNTTCPKTLQVLAHTNLISNYTVKALITNWCEANNVPLPEPAKLGASLPLRKLLGVRGRHDEAAANGHEAGRDAHDVVDCVEDDFSFASSMTPPRTLRTVRAQSFTGDSRGQENGTNEDWSFVSKRGCSSCLAEESVVRLRASPSGSSGSSDGQMVDEQATPRTVVSINLSDYSPYSSDVSGEMDRLSMGGSPASYERHHSFPAMRGPSHPRLAERPQRRQRGSMSIPSNSARRMTDGALQVLIENSIEDLKSDDVDLQRAAAKEIRLLAKYDAQNRILVAHAGAIKPLVELVESPDKKVQENAVTALLNLSINDKNKSEIVATGAIDPLVNVLKVGSPEAMENSAAALFSLSVLEENKAVIGASGAIPPLVDLLVNGSLRGQKDAATALFNLSLLSENKARIVNAGAVKGFVNLIKDPTSGMVDKAVAVLANLMTIPEGRVAIGDEGGIPALVEVVEAGSPRGKENAAAALLHLCTNSTRHRSMVLQEGAIPPLHALSQSGTARAKEKASALLRHFREQRHASLGSRSSQHF